VEDGNRFTLAIVVIDGSAVTVVMLVKVTIIVTRDGSPGSITEGTMGSGVTVVVSDTVACNVLDPIGKDTEGDSIGVALGMTGDSELGVFGGVDATG
jgi:hypothetical protein